ncbi:MAG: sigma-70 family RNA polymerase sigma factor [Gemmatimonas sp.]|nr:sigma-70 family RNA polymerase sigma factor [Gemmatimonas sp.]
MRGVFPSKQSRRAIRTRSDGRVHSISIQPAGEADKTDDTANLVRRSQAGDTAAYEGLYRAHVDRVYALCLRLTGDRERAAELTQDVFVRAWKRIGTFRGEATFGTWLHRVAFNVVRESQRSDARHRARLVEGVDLDAEVARTSSASTEDRRGGWTRG